MSWLSVAVLAIVVCVGELASRPALAWPKRRQSPGAFDNEGSGGEEVQMVVGTNL